MTGFLGSVLTQQIWFQPSTPVLTTSVPENADADIEGFVYRQIEEGGIHWEVEADTALVDESQHRAVLEGIHVRLFGKNGQKMELKAEEGTIDTATSNFDLRNRHNLIEIELANGYTILSPHIRWEDAEHAIRTNQPVTIHGHGLTMTGVGLLGTFTTETLMILDDVRVHIASSI